MAYRIYVCRWERKVWEGRKQIVNPIIENAEGQPGLEWVSNHYSPFDVNGNPTMPFCFVLVKSTAFDVLDSVSGIFQFPPGGLSGAINTGKRRQIAMVLNTNFEIPESTFDSCTTRKEVVWELLKHIHPNFKTLGDHIKDEDFA